jgi:hypothetical protein
MPVELRPAVEVDVAAIAAIWESGWRDGHLGNVPDELAALRTADPFRERAAEHVADTTAAEADGQVAGFVNPGVARVSCQVRLTGLPRATATD